jgi:hypothetical protein
VPQGGWSLGAVAVAGAYECLVKRRRAGLMSFFVRAEGGVRCGTAALRQRGRRHPGWSA